MYRSECIKGENMNAINLLKLDHRVVDALFQKAMALQPSKRGPVYKKISNELAAHAHIEEAIFYPRLMREGDAELKKIVLEGIEEHSQIHMFHDQLDKMKSTEERFEPKLTVLQEDIRHHVKEEENEMFDMVESQFSSEALDQLGKELEVERKRFQKAKGIPARTSADKALGQGMLSRLVDAVTGLFTDEKGGDGAKRSKQGANRSGAKGKSTAKASVKASASAGSDRKTSVNGTKKTSTTSKTGKPGSTKSKSASASSTRAASSQTNGKRAGKNASSGSKDSRSNAGNGSPSKSKKTGTSSASKTRGRRTQTASRSAK